MKLKLFMIILLLVFSLQIFAQRIATQNNRLPAGDIFYSWETERVWTRTYHVATENKTASDKNDGSINRPWKTINKAAKTLKPGERVIIHKGVYRERVTPFMGGKDASHMIGYFANKGEEVIVKGSDIWKPAFSRYSDGIYKAVIPDDIRNSQFTKENLFRDPTYKGVYDFVFNESTSYGNSLKRGQLFFEGKPLKQVLKVDELNNIENTFCISEGSIYVKLDKGSDPTGKAFEVSTREQIFAPDKKFLSYIIVSGIKFLHCANGSYIPTPQRGAVSAKLGTHWIIENCEVGYINTTAIDIGGQWWGLAEGQPLGSHIIRKNHIHHCGIGGITGWHAGANQNVLIENNLIEETGYLPLFEHYEIGAIKMHRLVGSIIRKNIIRNCYNGPGIWLDGWVSNTRITQNLIYNIKDNGFGGIFLEISSGPFLVDNNIILNTDQNGIHSTDADKIYIIQNFIGNNKTGASLDLLQASKVRFAPPQVLFEDEHFIAGNMFTKSTRYINMATKDDVCDYNAFGGLLKETDNLFSLYCTNKPENNGNYNLKDWNNLGFDKNSVSAKLDFAFDEKNLTLAVTCDKKNLSNLLDDKLGGSLVNNQSFAFEFIQNDFLGNTRLLPAKPNVKEGIIGLPANNKIELGPIVNMKLDGTVYKVDPRDK